MLVSYFVFRYRIHWVSQNPHVVHNLHMIHIETQQKVICNFDPIVLFHFNIFIRDFMSEGFSTSNSNETLQEIHKPFKPQFVAV